MWAIEIWSVPLSQRTCSSRYVVSCHTPDPVSVTAPVSKVSLRKFYFMSTVILVEKPLCAEHWHFRYPLFFSVCPTRGHSVDTGCTKGPRRVHKSESDISSSRREVDGGGRCRRRDRHSHDRHRQLTKVQGRSTVGVQVHQGHLLRGGVPHPARERAWKGCRVGSRPKRRADAGGTPGERARRAASTAPRRGVNAADACLPQSVAPNNNASTTTAALQEGVPVGGVLHAAIEGGWIWEQATAAPALNDSAAAASSTRSAEQCGQFYHVSW